MTRQQDGFSTIAVLMFSLATSVFAYTVSQRVSTTIEIQKKDIAEIRVKDFFEFSSMYLRDRENCASEIKIDPQGKISFAEGGAIKDQLKDLNLTLRKLKRSTSALPGGNFNRIEMEVEGQGKKHRDELYFYFVTQDTSLLACKSTALDQASNLPIEQRLCLLIKKRSFNPATGLCV